MRKRTDAIRVSESRYRKTGTRQFSVRFYRNTEPELLKYAESLDNFQGTVKELLQKQMKKGNE